ncbi:hypothetical protein QG37_06733 [Candidozyma auris]|uniref:Uncharacterized protein n=1 Tax=Candidozyma auris TaxID=498019 RepID=A0A0L0NS39_CANAR|nr:hypothetical protein QG37_06733 [[Candida] auris]
MLSAALPTKWSMRSQEGSERTQAKHHLLGHPQSEITNIHAPTTRSGGSREVKPTMAAGDVSKQAYTQKSATPGA